MLVKQLQSRIVMLAARGNEGRDGWKFSISGSQGDQYFCLERQLAPSLMPTVTDIVWVSELVNLSDNSSIPLGSLSSHSSHLNTASPAAWYVVASQCHTVNSHPRTSCRCLRISSPPWNITHLMQWLLEANELWSDSMLSEALGSSIDDFITRQKQK